VWRGLVEDEGEEKECCQSKEKGQDCCEEVGMWCEKEWCPKFFGESPPPIAKIIVRDDSLFSDGLCEAYSGECGFSQKSCCAEGS